MASSVRASLRAVSLEPAHIEDLFSRFGHLKDALNIGVGGVRWPPPLPALERLFAGKMGTPSYSCYGDVLGLRPLRVALLEKHGFLVGGGTDVLVTCGANQAMVNVALTLLDPGDAAIITAPYYFSHRAAIELAGATPIITGFQPDNLQPDVEAVANALVEARGRAKCVIVTSPNNPSGVIIEERRLRAIETACKEHGATLVMDEAYAEITHDGCRHVVPKGEGAVRIFTFSKAFGLAGWRVGYALFPSSLQHEMVKVQDTIATHAVLASQELALAALECGGADFVAEKVAGLAHAREVLWGAVKDTGAVRSQGGYYFCPPLPRSWKRDLATEAEAIRILAEEFKVIVTPGSAFGILGHFRCSYGSLGDDNLKIAAERLRRGLDRLQDTEPRVE